MKLADKIKDSKIGQKVSGWSLKKKVVVTVLLVLLIVAVTGGIVALAQNGTKKRSGSPFGSGNKKTDQEVNTAMAIKMDLTSEISSSGTIAAKNTYNITSLVSGEIIEADFKEGDTVKEGQVLYRIDASSMESELKSASNSLDRSETSFEDAKKDYEEALEEYSDNTYKSHRTGYITKLYIESGDKVGGNTQIADLYNEQQMKIKIPFLSGEAAYIGGNAVLTLTDTLEQIGASVYSVSNMDEVLEGGALVRYVTFSVQNPGGLTTEMTATAQVGDFISAGTGTFEPWTDTKLNCDLTGNTNVEVGKLLVHEGDFVKEGTPLFEMTEDSADKLIRTYRDALDTAEEKVEAAQQKVDSSSEQYDEYTIKAPVDGMVISKTYKVGDKVGNSGNQGSQTALAVVYDMSEYTFEMSVDELDVKNVEVGQKVRIEADAFEGETFYGRVTNVSLVSTAQNGVSTYPVTVTLDETYELLPGMNVDGYIVLGEAKDAIVVPSDALMRGNRVYVRDETVGEAEGVVPAGFRAVEVETGLTNEDYVQITSGIKEGTEVYVPETSDSGFGMFGGMPGGGMPGGGMPGGGMPGGSGGGRSGGGMPGVGGMPGGGR